MAQAHQIKVGDIDVAVLLEGASENTEFSIQDVGGRYPTATEAELTEALAGKSKIANSLNPVFINSNGTRILADVGFGPSRQPEMGNLIPALESIGVSPEDIDLVYLTHFHGDHIVGLVDADGNPTYPNAQYMTTEDEWDEWMGKWENSDDEGHQANYKMMQGLKAKFILAKDGDEVADGVTIVNIAGHTLGQSGLLVESNGERLIHLADVLHNEVQFTYTHWQFLYDSDGELGVKTRKSILQRCADENLLTVFYHLPFPGVGHVKAEGDAFSWNPIGK